MTKHWTISISASLATLVALFASAPVARADIFQWQYINPANPSLGKQQSTTLCPDGAGVYGVSGENLSNRNLTMAYMTGANLAAFPIYDENGYQIGYVGAANVTGGNLSQADLTNANVSGVLLTGANLTQANLTNANLSGDSYTVYDSEGAYIGEGLSPGADLTSANLSGADVRGARLQYATLSGANLSHANLANANFSGFSYLIYDPYHYLNEGISPGANLTNANLSGADTRGANFYLATLTGANTSNLIQANGHIAGVNLTSGASLVLRDYDGNPNAAPPTGPLPIVVDQHLAMNANGTLRLVFDADPWDSLISFAPGIPVARGGALELTFASDVNLASQVGRMIDLFDWTGVSPTGTFTISSPYMWNLSNLYTTGEVTLTALAAIPGDFNNNGAVDAADFIVWRKTDGTPAGYNAWRTHFGQSTANGSAPGSAGGSSAVVPEPASLPLFLLAVMALLTSPLRRRAAKNRC